MSRISTGKRVKNEVFLEASTSEGGVTLKKTAGDHRGGWVSMRTAEYGHCCLSSERGRVQIKSCGESNSHVGREDGPPVNTRLPQGPVPMGKRQELLLRRHVQHTGDVNSKGETCNGKEATLWRGSEGQLESSWKKSLRIIPGASHPVCRVVVLS